MFKIRSLLGYLFGVLLVASSLNAGPCLLVVEESANPSKQGQAAFNAFANESWSLAEKRFSYLKKNIPNDYYAHDALYYLGVCHYNLKKYAVANEDFTKYLKYKGVTRFFENTLEYKFAIAEKFRHGIKKRLFGVKIFPKWISGYDDALDIYDEVVSGLPGSTLAAQSLLSKAALLDKMKEYAESEDAYQDLIVRFPNTSFSADAYVALSKLYLKEGIREYQNPDFLALSKINLKKFQQDFPNDPRIQDAEKAFYGVEEAYAKGLYDTGCFYERIKKPQAAKIYYQSVVKMFPGTKVSKVCIKRLERL
jgi:outer membrane protein assembly factor BamD (BamD/ComL family)